MSWSSWFWRQQGSDGVVLSVNDWIFDVDIDATAAYCANVTADPCGCGYCRNFRSAVNDAYSQLNLFLAAFGSQVDAPEELMPYEPTVYEASYCISGRVLQAGELPITVGNCGVYVLCAEDTDYETQCAKPYFVLRTGCLELPWVLKEDMDEVISPANEPEYLQRMWDRLLQYAPEDSLNS